MSIQKIVDYVMHTPHNTNPAILKQVINDNISWNDLKDKPFGTGTETVVVLEETTLMNFNAAGTAEFTPAASLEEGKTYTVIWNGTKYSCVAFYLKSWGGCCIGNRSKIGFTDNTGEPFAIITGNSTSAVVAGKDCTTATVSITTEKEIIHTIDPKYLPSGGYDLVVDGAECRIVSGSHATVRDKMLRGEVPSVCLLSTYYMESGVIRFEPDNKFTGVSYYTDEDIIIISIGEDSYKVHADGTVELYQN